MPDLDVIVLAAGQGKRMRSDLPKVVHALAGRPLLAWVVDAAFALAPRRVHVVYGSGGDIVREKFRDLAVDWVHQAEQLGTGDAVGRAMAEIPNAGIALVLYGDVPLVSPDDLMRVVSLTGTKSLGLLTVELDDPTGYGRIMRDGAGRVIEIVEHRDANHVQREVREVNTGILAVRARELRGWLEALTTDNAQGERYLTDVVAMAVREGFEVATLSAAVKEEVLGVNDRAELADLERFYQRRRALDLMRDGVTLRDPDRLDVRGELIAGKDVTIDVNVVLEGVVKLGHGVSIGPNNVIRDMEIGDGTQVLANCVLEHARVGRNCRIGPFSRIRPGTVLAEDVHIGNFVEVKNSEIAAASKVNHLTYVGDTDVGRNVNVGAGTITCNYDGVNKHRTVIEDGAFIGSGTELVAPVRVGRDATIGAGSTISRDTPPGELTLERGRQTTVSGWKRPAKVKS